MKYGLKNEAIDSIHNVLKCYTSISEVIIYGSRAKGAYKNGSDIDLTIKGDKLNLLLLNQVANNLDDLLLPYHIDLSIYSQIENSDLLDHINRVGKIFYSRS